ncbi:MAG: NUDIX domain-containing protein [Myxococcota bacterium]
MAETRDDGYIDPVKESAGILMFRRRRGAIEVLVAHPGGPFFSRRSSGAWTIPKGLIEPGEDAETAARREFEEETGFPCRGELFDLGSVRLKSGKVINAYATEGDLDPAELRSNLFEMEWPRRSGKIARFPEVDEVRFAGPDEARELLNPAQAVLVDRLLMMLAQV